MRIVAIMYCYNERDIIAQTVEHLVESGLELVVVDNGSDDGIYEILILRFNVFEFWPTETDDAGEPDIRRRHRHYSWISDWQFVTWKHHAGTDIVSSGGAPSRVSWPRRSQRVAGQVRQAPLSDPLRGAGHEADLPRPDPAPAAGGSACRAALLRAVRARARDLRYRPPSAHALRRRWTLAPRPEVHRVARPSAHHVFLRRVPRLLPPAGAPGQAGGPERRGIGAGRWQGRRRRPGSLGRIWRRVCGSGTRQQRE